jgi:hypothetical protein
MTEAIPTKKLIGLPPGSCIHQPGKQLMNIIDLPSRGQGPAAEALKRVLDIGGDQP